MATAFIIDFDDTLVHTDAKVLVNKSDGQTLELTPYEYVNYQKEPGDQLDYSQFETLVNVKPIPRFVNLLKRVVADKLVDVAIILSARGKADPIHEFLKSIQLSKVTVAALGNSNPEKKAEFIEKLIQRGYNRIMFIDDAEKNIHAVQNIAKKYPKTKIITHQADKQHFKSQRNKSDSLKSKHGTIKALLNKKIKNPDTGRDILIGSALRYDKKSAVYRSAMAFITNNT